MSKLPFKVEIPTPCTQSWDAMSGTPAARHCDSCNSQVVNFAHMTPRQIERAVLASGGHLCARITRNTSGDIITADSLRPSPLQSLTLSAALAITPALAAQTISQDKSEVSTSVRATTASISGRVLDTTGSPIPNAQIQIFSKGGPTLFSSTAHDGSYSTRFAPGSYTMRISASGFISTSQIFEVEAGHAYQIPPITLQIGSVGQVVMVDPKQQTIATLEGRVLDANGAPIPHATVRLLQLNRAAADTNTDSNGVFHVDLPTGGYIVLVNARDFAQHTSGISLTSASTIMEPIVLRPDTTEFVSGGAIVTKIDWRYRLRHPFRTIKYACKSI